ncbi:acyl-CoA dehydrogenase family protein [Mycobacterium vicinigordonae]|uniref:Acyl-CoA dehydrogenase family protein n=1 Tax=Mycobacterium vicinigordonae TaxID=1719132 RepID=A0A7D6E1B3_9MYCO|nr:acyl-CoA dehydrogenase family protein [Mycobacterium vicinigordonae]QLL09807.1 acyl-CoA dehydrogenase family protein [Mycobacterium vicinigordonae]
MDLSFTDEDRAFRSAVRAWLRYNIPATERPADAAGARAWDMAWQRRQFDGGYGGIAWPREYGGQGLPLVRQLIWFEEYARADGPDIGCGFVGINHGGPTLIARGSEEQKRRHLPKILAGEEVWCQGFSEPGAGSDLAAISARAFIEGNELVVNGQKIWTSYAHVADYQELLVRTDPDSARHRGLTWVICDMHSPGITVRPIISMDGLAEFCEVFYDDVRLPLDNVVGEIGDGWSVAMSTLGFERGTGFIKLQTELAVALERLNEDAASLGLLEDSGLRAMLGDLHADVVAMRAMTYATVSSAARADVPGPEGSMIKIFYGDLAQRIHRARMDVIGVYGLDRGGRYGRDIGEYLYSYATTVGGGTSEVQRDIVGERILGLPRNR